MQHAAPSQRFVSLDPLPAGGFFQGEHMETLGQPPGYFSAETWSCPTASIAQPNVPNLARRIATEMPPSKLGCTVTLPGRGT